MTRARRAHQDLKVWQEAMALARNVYAVTDRLPMQEAFGLTSQMRRAAVSVPSNIAEGAARTSEAEFLHALSIARGSLSELETQLQLASDLGMLTECEAEFDRIETVFALLGGLIRSVKAQQKGTKGSRQSNQSPAPDPSPLTPDA